MKIFSIFVILLIFPLIVLSEGDNDFFNAKRFEFKQKEIKSESVEEYINKTKEQPEVDDNSNSGFESSNIPQGNGRAILSLIISSSDTKKVFKNLRNLVKVHRKRNVSLGQVMIVYNKKSLEKKEEIFSSPELGIITKDIKSKEFFIEPVLEIPKKFNITTSPAWVIRYQGKDHVFQGNYQPLNFFTKEGFFRANEL